MTSIGMIANESNTTVCKMYHSIAPKRANAFRNHKHTDFELSLILSGEGSYYTPSGNLDIRAGDILLFSTNEPHCITDIYTEDMRILNLHIQPFFLWNTEGSYLTNDYLKIFFDRNANFCNRLDRNNPAIADATALLLAIKKEFEEAQSDYATAIRALLLQLLITIRRRFPIVNEEGKKRLAVQNIDGVVRAVAYIDDNFTSDITLEEIAAEAYLSKSHFCVLFKKLNGLTPWEYINIKRINKAVELLKTTNESVLDIATQCGYNNTANFNKIFKSITKQTPKAYRVK